MSKSTGIEEARKVLGDLVTDAQYGHTTTITKHGKPAARIVPIEEPSMTFTSHERKRDYIADVGAENAEWITTNMEMRAMLHGEVTHLGEGRIRITADGHEILSELSESESADGQISDGMIWFEGDGYALTPAS